MEVEGMLILSNYEETVQSVTSDGYEVHVRLEISSPSAPVSNSGVTSTIAMSQAMDYVISYTTTGVQTYELEGTMEGETRVELELDSGGFSADTVTAGRITGSSEVRSWAEIEGPVQRFMINRVVKRALQKL